MSVYKKENSYTNGYFYSPVSLLGIPKEKIQWNDLREKNLVKIKETYQGVEDDIISFAALKQMCTYTKAKEEDKLEFNKIFKALENYRDTLTATHGNCLNTSCTNSCCNFTNQDEEIGKQLEKCLSKMQLIVDKKLSATDIAEGKSANWVFQSDCIEGNNLKIDFESEVTSANPFWEKLDKKIELECLVNGKVVKSFGGTTNKIAKVSFSDALVINQDITKDIRFSIRVKKVSIDFIGSELSDKTLKFQNAKLKVRIAD